MNRFKYFFAILFSIIAAFFVSAAAVNAAPSLPDLKIESLTVDPANYNVKVLISNIGDAPLQLPGTNSTVYLLCFNSSGVSFECPDRIKFFRALPNVPDFLEPGARLEVIFSPRSDEVAKVTAGMFIKDQFNNTIREKSTANNFISSTPIPRKPDFVFESVSLTDQDFAYAVKNNGGGERAQAGVELQWLRQDKTTIGNSFQQIIETPAAGGSASFNYRNDGYGSDISKFLWHDTPRDAAILRVTLNYSDTILESNTANNTAEANRLFPDLKLDSLTFDPDTGKPKVTISNIGRGTSTFTGTTDPCADMYIGGRNAAGDLRQDTTVCLATVKSGLAPGESATFPIDFTLNADIVSIFGILNYSDLINEGASARYQNNTIEYVPMPLPDIKVNSVTFDPQTNAPKVTISNIGHAAAAFAGTNSNVTLVCYDSSNARSDCPNDKIYFRSLQDSLAPGGTMEVLFTPRLEQTSGITAIAYLFKDEASHIATEEDSNNKVNNSIFIRVPPMPLPDLVVDSVTFDSTLRYPIITIKNQGNAPAKNTDGIGVNYVWLNQSDVASGGDSFLTGDLGLATDQILSVGLQEGQSPGGSATLPGPDSVRVRVSVDYGSDIYESNEDNNIMEADVPEADADELDYPIAELGNCQTKEDCRVYCEQPENVEACANFGKITGLLTEEEIKALKDMSKIVKGPGDCKNKEECAVVCEKPENTDACLDFAEQNNWMSADDLSKARKVAQVLQDGGATPGGCNTPGGCKDYCSGNTHAVECVAFGKTVGLLTAEEAAEAEKVAPLMQSGAMPGGKTNREELEAYCENNWEECDKFFEQAGVKKEGEKSEGEGPDDGPEEGPKDGEPKDGEPKDETKIPSIFNKNGAEDGGASPGGCKTKAECDAYCDSHPGECDEQVKQAGGEVKEATAICSTREECESFCDDPANKEAESCKDGTIIIKEEPPESLGPTEGPGEDPLEKLRSDIQEVISQSQSQDCVKQILGEEVFTKFVIEGGIPEKAISREELQPCFDEAKQAVEQQEMIKMQKKPDDPDMGSPPQ